MKKWPAVLLLSFFVQSVFSPLSYAISPEQREVIQSGVYYFNIEETPPAACNGTTNLVGAENENKVYNFLLQQGFQPYQAAGIMGNMQAEAHFEPRLVEYGYKNSRGEVSKAGQPSSLDDNVPPDQNSKGQPGYGIVQWTAPNRKQNLRDRTAAKGVKGSDLAAQLEYLMEELKGSYKASTYDPILAAKTLEEVSDIFMTKFERPGNQSEAKKEERRQFGRDILARNGSNGSSSSADVVCGGSGEVVNGYSLPVDKKWYDQHPEWFSKPHHDYPASDIPVPTGTNIYSMTAGKVLGAPVGGDCGQGVEIDAGNGMTYKYCHGTDGGSIPGAKQGDTVSAGQLIMHSGDTGNSSGPHLHLEIKVDGGVRCPQPLFKSIAEGSPQDPKNLPTTGCVSRKEAT